MQKHFKDFLQFLFAVFSGCIVWCWSMFGLYHVINPNPNAWYYGPFVISLFCFSSLLGLGIGNIIWRLFE